MKSYKLNVIEQLVFTFSKLPGLGQRSARRIVLHLMQDKEIRVRSLIKQLTEMLMSTQECEYCGNIDDKPVCSICSDLGRDNTTISVVESVAELWAIERSQLFKGKYHVLGGTLSARNNLTPDSLGLPKLMDRIEKDKVEEIILATNSTLDGQMTAFFIADYLKLSNIRVSRLASGIPMGSELDYLDEGTLSIAITSRQLFTDEKRKEERIV